MGNEGWAGDRSIGCCFAGSCSWSVWVCKVGGGRKQVPSSCSLDETRRIRQALFLSLSLNFQSCCKRGLFSQFPAPFSPFYHCFAGIREQHKCSPTVACFFKVFFRFFHFLEIISFSSNLSYVVCFLPKFIPLWGQAISPTHWLPSQTVFRTSARLLLRFCGRESSLKFVYRRKENNLRIHQSNLIRHGINCNNNEDQRW